MKYYFVHVTETWDAEPRLSDPYCHVTLSGERYFRGHCLKLVQSRNILKKQPQVLSTVICLFSDEIYDTSIDINSNL